MKTKTYILLAEDDYNLGAIIKKRLEEQNYEVTLCHDGEEAWESFQKRDFDLCLLDIVMPKKNGLELAKLIRGKNELIPVLFLTSKGNDEDKIKGFRHGGDDYVTKPFSMQELLLRIEVFLKRTKAPGAGSDVVFSVGIYVFNFAEMKILERNGNLAGTLTKREAEFLKFLCENAGKILKREEILYHVWGKDDYFLGRSMDVFATKIRSRFAADKSITLETLHGVGFRFHAEVKKQHDG